MNNDNSPLEDLDEHLRNTGPILQRAEELVASESQDAPTDDERKRTHKLKNDDFETDIDLKKRYAKWLIGVMIGQLLIMNLVFACVGLKWMEYSDFILHLYISGTLLELFGLVLVITKYLFKKQ